MGSEHQCGTVGGISVSASEDQLAPLLRLPGKPEVLLAERSPTFDVVIDHLVEKQEVHDDRSPFWGPERAQYRPGGTHPVVMMPVTGPLPRCFSREEG